MEAFHTIQGEGFHQGKAAYFIRLAGCDVGCHWCDVKESWDREAYPEVPLADIISKGLMYPARMAVITGGEPLMHDLTALTSALKEAGFNTHIETSGVYPLTGIIDWICFSPKKFKPSDPVIFDRAHELKVIIYHQNDLEWAMGFQEKINPACRLYLQPEWSRREKMIPLIRTFILENPQWEISLQIHKYMNIP
ncbi:MAG: radical SAM protein [Cyclobacteriaceae bacterium]|nr:radical SAM protein [Cyclobacteriaceae bacterium]